MSVTVGAQPVYIRADGDEQKLVTNVAGGSVSYGSNNGVFVSEGTVAVGSSVTLDQGKWFVSSSTSVLQEEAAPSAMEATARLDVGTGDEQDVYGANLAGIKGRVYHGTAASPVMTVGPTFKVNRTESVTEEAIEAIGGGGTDGGHMLASIMGVSSGLVDSQVQAVGVYGGAKTASTYAVNTGNDACGLYGIGRVQGAGADGVGIGAFVIGRRDVDTGKVTGIEAHCANYTATAGTYSSTSYSDTVGVWLNCSGNADSAVGIAVSNAFGRRFKVGLAFTGQVTGALTGGVVDASIRDDSASATSLLVKGTHATAAVAVGAGSGKVIVGAEAEIASGALLEVVGPNAVTDPLAVVGSVANTRDYTIRVRNAVGQTRWGVVGSAGSLLTGTVAGDMVLGATTAGKTLHLGGTTRVVSVSQDNKLGFFAAAPVVQPSGTPAAATDLASVITLANSLRTNLLALGLVA